MASKRLDYLDVAKGIAIILVVFGHVDYGTNPVCIWIYSFHLPIFFIVSGMLINYKQELKVESKTLLRKKSLSLLIPYFSFSILSIIYNISKALIYNQGAVLSNIKISIYTTLSFSGMLTLWFLPCLLFGEMLFILVVKKFLNKSWLIICFFTVSAIAVSIVLKDNLIIPGILKNMVFRNLLIVIFRSLIAMSFISIGYYLFSLQKKIASKQELRNYKELIFGCALFVVNIFISQQNGVVNLRDLTINNVFFYYGCAIIGSVSILLICKNLSLIKGLSYFGVNSLIIMVTHLNFPMIDIAKQVTSILIRSTSIENRYLIDCINVSIILIMEYFIIKIVNNYFAFMLGKRKFIRTMKMQLINK